MPFTPILLQRQLPNRCLAEPEAPADAALPLDLLTEPNTRKPMLGIGKPTLGIGRYTEEAAKRPSQWEITRPTT